METFSLRESQSGDQLRQMPVGKITFASGEQFYFTDENQYLEAIRKELPCHNTTGFRFETLLEDSRLRAAVKDILFDFFDMESENLSEQHTNTYHQSKHRISKGQEICLE